MPKATTINHITILVRDKRKAEKFYTKILGLKKIMVGHSLWMKVGDQYIHISDSSGKPANKTFSHFAIEFENILEVINAIIANGVDVFDLDQERRPIAVNTELEKKNRQYFVRDYDGNLIELVDAKSVFFHPQ